MTDPQTEQPEKQKLPELNLTGAKLSVVKPEVMKERRRTRGSAERSKAQKTLDTLVAKAYEAWVTAGKPEDFGERPGGHIRIPEGQQLTVVRALHNSGAFLNMSIRFGDVQVTDGYADIVFSVTDRVKRPRAASAKVAAEASAES
jgi:hypothetical protein